MFSFVSCLVISSLALASWLILYYLKLSSLKPVWDEEEFDINLDLQGSKLQENVKSFSEETGPEGFINFIFVATCIFLLLKVIHLTNEYIATKKAQEEATYFQSSKIPKENSPRIEEYLKEHEQLCAQISILKANNSELEDRVRELERSNLLLKKGSLNCCKHSPSKKCIKCSESTQQNIFISNQHFHVNPDPCPQTNFTFIWQNYLEMQKCGTKAAFALVKPKICEQKLELLSRDTKNLASSSVTVIVSTEDLQKMQGLLPAN